MPGKTAAPAAKKAVPMSPAERAMTATNGGTNTTPATKTPDTKPPKITVDFDALTPVPTEFPETVRDTKPNPTTKIIREASDAPDVNGKRPGYEVIVPANEIDAIKAAMQRAGRAINRSVHIRTSLPKDGRIKLVYMVGPAVKRPRTAKDTSATNTETPASS